LTSFLVHCKVVSAAGAMDHEDIVDKVDKLFTKISTDTTTADQLVKANPARFIGSDVRTLSFL
jgi:mitochondrial-processing peptidase subunit beta